MRLFASAFLAASALAGLVRPQAPKVSAEDLRRLAGSRPKGGGFRLVTVKRGGDNDREALFRFTYTLGLSTFFIKKEVRPEGAPEFLERNTYSWKR